MNILFYTYNKVNSTKGGTERTTISIATGLTHYYNCRCFSMYEKASQTIKEDCFISEYHWNISSDSERNIMFLKRIIIDNHIDIIINQGIFINTRYLREATKDLNCKIILAHHFAPGAELLFFTFKKLVPHTSFNKWCKNLILFPYRYVVCLNKLKQSYKQAYKLADSVVLLSKNFIPLYQKYGRFKNSKKFKIIPNALSFNEFLSNEEYKKKKKEVLIVARLDETHKRLSLAIKIWMKIKKSPIGADWKLYIVGEGPSLPIYQQYIKKNNIQDIYFEGRNNPISYYKQASIFLMTSKSESWGLTLTEAQQFGVVPIAFNSYASLTDIITNEKDGIIINEGDIDMYEKKLLEIMENESKRQTLALQGIINCKRFSQEKISQQWWNLFKELKVYD